MNAEDPLFILYTSGSPAAQGRHPRHGGYAVRAIDTTNGCSTPRGRLFWCTADPGWITGHSYVRLWAAHESARPASSPTASPIPRFRALLVNDCSSTSCDHLLYRADRHPRPYARWCDLPVKVMTFSSLRLLGTVGEPINPEAWIWYQRVIGEERMPVVDTWWRRKREGSFSPLPGAVENNYLVRQPNVAPALSRCWSMPNTVARRKLARRQPSPSLAGPGRRDDAAGPRRSRGLLSKPNSRSYPGLYFTGDGCRRDEDGYYWITGRVDDVHERLAATASARRRSRARWSHAKVEEAVVGLPARHQGPCH